jgi:hypothetical protein
MWGISKVFTPQEKFAFEDLIMAVSDVIVLCTNVSSIPRHSHFDSTLCLSSVQKFNVRNGNASKT